MSDPLSSYGNFVMANSPRALMLAPAMRNLLQQFTINGQGQGYKNFATQVAGLSPGLAIMAGGADPFRGMYAKQNVGAELMQQQGIGTNQMSGMLNNVLRSAGMNTGMINQFNQTMTPLGYHPLPQVNQPGFFSPTPWGQRSFYTGFANPNPIWFHR
jgi:hypothetical protein